MFNRIVLALVAIVFGLAFYDAWKVTGRASTAIAIAVVPTLILAAAFIAAAIIGGKTGRRLLLRIGASSILLLGVVAYTHYAVIAPRGGPDSASQMHIVFFPLVLGVLAVLVVGGCAVAAYAWRQKSNNALEGTRER